MTTVAGLRGTSLFRPDYGTMASRLHCIRPSMQPLVTSLHLKIDEATVRETGITVSNVV